jgi:hypothetical protein
MLGFFGAVWLIHISSYGSSLINATVLPLGKQISLGGLVVITLSHNVWWKRRDTDVDLPVVAGRRKYQRGY